MIRKVKNAKGKFCRKRSLCVPPKIDDKLIEHLGKKSFNKYNIALIIADLKANGFKINSSK